MQNDWHLGEVVDQMTEEKLYQGEDVDRMPGKNDGKSLPIPTPHDGSPS